jgi:hypothetical protein
MLDIRFIREPDSFQSWLGTKRADEVELIEPAISVL